jgi:hypothetical protein
MDPANYREAVREAKADEAEGADIMMVKPGWAGEVEEQGSGGVDRSEERQTCNGCMEGLPFPASDHPCPTPHPPQASGMPHLPIRHHITHRNS